MLWKGFQRPKRLDFERDTLTDRFGRFYAQPFERGFGTTIGNSMRRILLSSLEGAAVTEARIEGVRHEFTTIPGVVEDVTDICLNLKSLIVKNNSLQAQKIQIAVAITLHRYAHGDHAADRENNGRDDLQGCSDELE